MELMWNEHTATEIYTRIKFFGTELRMMLTLIFTASYFLTALTKLHQKSLNKHWTLVCICCYRMVRAVMLSPQWTRVNGILTLRLWRPVLQQASIYLITQVTLRALMICFSQPQISSPVLIQCLYLMVSVFVLGWANGNMRYVSKRAMVNHEAGRSFILKCMVKMLR